MIRLDVSQMLGRKICRRRTFVQPFMLVVMMTCGAKREPPLLCFHFSRRGRKANVMKYGPIALV